MAALKARVTKLECLSGIGFPTNFERIVCDDGESSGDAIKRLEITIDDGVNRIFRVIVEPKPFEAQVH